MVDVKSLANPGTFANAVAKDQKENRSSSGKLSSSWMLDPNPSQALTTYMVGDILTGATLHKERGATIDVFNQELSKELEDTNATLKDAGIPVDTRLNPYDTFTGNLRASLKNMGGMPAGNVAGAPGAATGSYTPQTQYTGSHADIINTLSWTASGGNKANNNAAIQFIKAVWPGHKGIGGYRASGSVATSDHPKGLAVDAMVAAGNAAAAGSEFALGLEISDWFASNPGVFNLKYIIFYDFACYTHKGNMGWVPYGPRSGNTLMHRDHVHLSFNEQPAGPGAPGTAWPAVGSHPFKGQK